MHVAVVVVDALVVVVFVVLSVLGDVVVAVVVDEWSSW